MKTPAFERVDYDDAVHSIQRRIKHQPTIGLILGTGLGEIADSVSNPEIIPYTELPHWPHSSVIGHSNRAVIGSLEGKEVMVLQGRSHFYEGYTMQEITFSVRVMQLLGIKTLIVTNSAGGVPQADPTKTMSAGDVMLITDHIFFPGLVGQHPLVGPNDDAFGTRFPDMTAAYTPELRDLARRVAQKAGVTLREGIYACLSGPSFETPAEITMMRVIGAQAVGMSTAPEVIVARHGGMRVLGFSGIANIAPDSFTKIEQETTHEEVLKNTNEKIVPNLSKILRGVLAEM